MCLWFERLRHWLKCYRATSGRPDRRRVWREARRYDWFFLPCPICGEWFSGQEIAHLETRSLFVRVSDGPGKLGHGLLVCPKETCRESAALSWSIHK